MTPMQGISSSAARRVRRAFWLTAFSLALAPAAAQTPEQWRQICENPDLQKALLERLTDDNLAEAEVMIEDYCAQIDLPATPVHEAAVPRPEASHSDWVLDARFSPDGRTIVSAGGDGTVRVWDAETGKPIRDIMVAPEVRRGDKTRTGAVRFVEFVGDGSRIAVASEGNPVRVIELATGEFVGEVVVSPDDFGGIIAAGGGLLFGGGNREAVDAYDPQTLAVRYSLSGQNAQDGVVIAVSEAAGIVATAAGSRGTWPPREVAIVFAELDTGDVVSGILLKEAGTPSSLAFSPDGTRIAIALRGTAYVYSIADLSRIQSAEQRLVQSMFLHPFQSFSLAFTADGAGLITCGSHPVLWDVETGRKLHHFGPFRDACHSVDVSPDGRFAVTTSFGSDVRIWEIGTGTFHRRLGINVEPPR